MCCLFRALIRFACLSTGLIPVTLSAAAQLDWGDAPASYGTRVAQNGPRHEINATLRLGKRIDAESNGLASPDGTGDDADGLDDEDGIVSVTPMILGGTTTVKLESSAAGFLDAWIDFNRDGDFADAGEKVAHARTLVAGTNTLNLVIPANASSGETAVRLRLSSVGSLNFDGPALDGEVEDHRIALLPAPPPSGTHPRAHYAHGQVWVVWDVDTNNLPETYAIYASPAPVTNTTQATLVGRLFDGEYFRPNLISDVEFTFGGHLLSGYQIPGVEGATHHLKATEGLFVDTVRASGSAYYAVVPFGQTTVSSSERTTNTVRFTFSTNEPPRPHLQVRAQDTTGHTISFFTSWDDGGQSDRAARSDFPLMANYAKRGVGRSFSATEPLHGFPAAAPWPATVCLAGGNGGMRSWLPRQDGHRSINVEPTDGLLLAFDDEFYRNPRTEAANTAYLGYARELDPFVPGVLAPGSTVYNYTQRRIMWCVDWLIATGRVDPHRVSLLGHSLGAQGAQMLPQCEVVWVKGMGMGMGKRKVRREATR